MTETLDERPDAARKPDPSPRPKRGRPKATEPTPGRMTVVSIKGTAEWKAWLSELADHCHLSEAVAIDHGLLALARANGFEKPMPKRQRR